MYEIVQLRYFKKDIKDLRRQKLFSKLNKLEKILNLLKSDSISRIAKSHCIMDPLLPNCRECHIEWDFVLIYKYDINNRLLLLRVGKHDDVYKKSWVNRDKWLVS